MGRQASLVVMRFMIGLLALSFAADVAAALPPAAPRPIRPLASYVQDSDYPREALRMGTQGTVRFSLDIAPDGQVVGCAVTASAGDAALDQGTCDLMKARARFEPATDAGGRAVAGRFDSSITWNLVSLTSPYPIGEMIAHTALRVTAAGAPSCAVMIAGTVVERREGDCGDLARTGAADALRRLRREAQLNYQFEVLRPDMPVTPPPPRQVMILERQVLLSIDGEGRVTGCERQIDRVGRSLDGLAPLRDLCLYRPPTPEGRFPVADNQADGHQERIHDFLWLRTATPAALR